VTSVQAAVTEPWEASACVVCGDTAAVPSLAVPHAEAPGGRSAIVRCRSCGLRRLDPRPAPSHIGRYYAADHNAFVGRRRGARTQALWELLRDAGSGWRGSSRTARLLAPLLAPLARHVFDVVVPLDARTGPRVLEVGCGYGDLLVYLRSRGCAVLGIDLDARAAAAGRALGLDVRVGTLGAAALPAASVDVAVLCHSLEHVPDPKAELRELARIVRPGGRLHIAVPNADAATWRAEGAAWEHVSPPLHFWFFDAASLTRLLHDAGFQPRRPAAATNALRLARRFARELRTLGPSLAARRLLRPWWARLTSGAGGDVLRVVAVRRPPAGSPSGS